MYKNEREELIMSVLEEKKYISVNELSEITYASASSIRRDLDNLARKGLVKRSYGGVSIMETIVASCMQKFNASRKKVSLIVTVVFTVAAVIVCMGYSLFYFEVTLPNGTVGQLLDVLDYISNYLIMPVISLLTCVLIGWIKKPSWVIEEMEYGGAKFSRKGLYSVVLKYFAPAMMFILLLKAVGLF